MANNKGTKWVKLKNKNTFIAIVAEKRVEATIEINMVPMPDNKCTVDREKTQYHDWN